MSFQQENIQIRGETVTVGPIHCPVIKCCGGQRPKIHRSRMSHYTDEPRYTIEQIDLLQRLRRTGMTKPEILHALDTLERLDREHWGQVGRPPPFLCPPGPTTTGLGAKTKQPAPVAGRQQQQQHYRLLLHRQNLQPPRLVQL
ncbi:hypothetical protein AALO_G00241580 [Alosa alosa]|uniref:HNF-p1 domain-containing protein n=1 Tax=Alosa alosa TaxID=278164 RepID=A0AAV6FRA4_9TELE|nr:hypothetical protein AALO_G00241580 [Alosa alosa]